MQPAERAKWWLISFVIFMLVFTKSGQPGAGFWMWLFFVSYVMPVAWR